KITTVKDAVEYIENKTSKKEPPLITRRIVLSRRVVVTGVGLLTPLGIGTEASWQAIRSGQSGIGSITQFDATAFSCRIAGEVKGFDPAVYIEKKEIKKMGRFIQFAVAAAECAMSMS